MKVGDYKISWRYNKEKTTGCYINQLSDVWAIVDPIGIGSAQTYAKDRFCKDKGRKVSLKYAMEGAGFSKAQRTEIWEAYRNMTRKRRW